MDLSYRAQIMSKDVAVATVAGNAVTPVREDLLPLFFKRVHPLKIGCAHAPLIFIGQIRVCLKGSAVGRTG